MTTTLNSLPGLSNGSVTSVPENFTQSWFRRFIRDFLQWADARNAIGANGIMISGNINTPATIGLGGTPATGTATATFTAANKPGANGAVIGWFPVMNSAGAVIGYSPVFAP